MTIAEYFRLPRPRPVVGVHLTPLNWRPLSRTEPAPSAWMPVERVYRIDNDEYRVQVVDPTLLRQLGTVGADFQVALKEEVTV